MKTRLPKLFLFLLISSILFFACSEDEYTIDRYNAINLAVATEALSISDPSNPKPIEIQTVGCFTGEVYCMIENADHSNYGFNWTHNGSHAGHDETTLCLCGGTIEVEITNLKDGTMYQGTKILPPCNELIQ